MKQIISIIIIVVALAGSGVFVYLTFFAGNSNEEKSISATTAKSQSVPSDILPLGSSLNFDLVKSYNKEQRIFQYPAVNPVEIGSAMNAIIKQ